MIADISAARLSTNTYPVQYVSVVVTYINYGARRPQRRRLADDHYPHIRLIHTQLTTPRPPPPRSRSRRSRRFVASSRSFAHHSLYPVSPETTHSTRSLRHQGDKKFRHSKSRPHLVDAAWSTSSPSFLGRSVFAGSLYYYGILRSSLA